MMQRDQFEALVTEAIAEIPVEIRDRMENLAFFVEDRHAEEPDLLGLYEGVLSINDRIESEGGFDLPEQITIYRLAICEMCRNEAEIRKEVRITVLHEVGHFLGLDEEEIDELGYA